MSVYELLLPTRVRVTIATSHTEMHTYRC